MQLSVVIRALLIILIVLQSFSAIAPPTSDVHQVDLEHLQTQHSHNNDQNIINEKADDTQHKIKDCHHCGHCSGSHLSWLLASNSNTDAKLHSINKVPYLPDVMKESINTILRPPIS